MGGSSGILETTCRHYKETMSKLIEACPNQHVQWCPLFPRGFRCLILNPKIELQTLSSVSSSSPSPGQHRLWSSRNSCWKYLDSSPSVLNLRMFSRLHVVVCPHWSPCPCNMGSPCENLHELQHVFEGTNLSGRSHIKIWWKVRLRCAISASSFLAPFVSSFD